MLERLELERIRRVGTLENNDDTKRAQFLPRQRNLGPVGDGRLDGALELSSQRLPVRARLDIADAVIAASLAVKLAVLGPVMDQEMGQWRRTTSHRWLSVWPPALSSTRPP
jgi:hypothetical protein